jgi:hypothetical protein
MSYKGYELFYVNGSSYTFGGGLEDDKIWPESDGIRRGYKELYNISWEDTVSEVNYAARLSKLINIPCINEAACGGGPDRVVRMAYEFLENNWENRHKLFLFLEVCDHTRSEFYYNPWNNYFICNSEYINNEQYQHSFLYSTTKYSPNPEGIEELQPIFKDRFDKFHNPYEFWKNVNRDLIGLYSFCKLNGIAIKFMDATNFVFYRELVDDKDKFINHIHWYANDNKKFIYDEVPGYTTDKHPGYFAHIEYAHMLKTWLDENLDPTGDQSNDQIDYQKMVNTRLEDLRKRDPFIYKNYRNKDEK